jgi:hypothetical protein
LGAHLSLPAPIYRSIILPIIEIDNNAVGVQHDQIPFHMLSMAWDIWRSTNKNMMVASHGKATLIRIKACTSIFNEYRLFTKRYGFES